MRGFGDCKKRIKVRLFTDSKPTLESIASSKQVERKTLRPTIVDLKERLVDKDIFFIFLATHQRYMGWCDDQRYASSPGPRGCLPEE